MRRLAEEGEPAVTRAARELGRRGGGALRPLALRLECGGRGLDGRPGRAAAACTTLTGIALPEALGRARGRARRRARGAQAARARRGLPGAAHRAGAGARVDGSPARASCSARSASSATRSPSPARRRTPARRRWTSGATRWRARPGSSSRSARSPKRTGEGAVCTMGGVVTKPGIVTSVVETAECLLDQRHLDATKLAEMLSNAEAASQAVRAGGGRRGRVGADLEHRADPVRRGADRAGGRVDPRGRGRVPPPAERPAARRGRGRARGRPDGDALRPEPARPLAHEARGHEGRALGAVGSGARPAGGQDDRPSRRRLVPVRRQFVVDVMRRHDAGGQEPDAELGRRSACSR